MFKISDARRVLPSNSLRASQSILPALCTPDDCVDLRWEITGYSNEYLRMRVVDLLDRENWTYETLKLDQLPSKSPMFQHACWRELVRSMVSAALQWGA